MRRYAAVALERAMKVQEVFMQAMAKKITWMQAAEIMGVTDRTMRRWKRRHEKHGYVLDQRWGRPSDKKVAVETIEKVLGLYRDRIISNPSFAIPRADIKAEHLEILKIAANDD
jgi:hypothetical protein